MDFDYKHHLSNELQETIALGKGEFPKKLLDPLIIVSEAHWHLGRFEIDAYVLAASHAVVITLNDEVFVQVIACNSLKDSRDFQHYEQRTLQGTTESFSRNFGEWKLASEIHTHNEELGKSIFNVNNFELRLDQEFPGEGNPSTSIGIHELNGKIEVFSSHSYPLEKIAVNSKLSIER